MQISTIIGPILMVVATFLLIVTHALDSHYRSQAIQCRVKLDFWCPADEKCLASEANVNDTIQNLADLKTQIKNGDHKACFKGTWTTAPAVKAGENKFGENGALFLAGCLFGDAAERLRFNILAGGSAKEADYYLDSTCQITQSDRCMKGCDGDLSKCGENEIPKAT